MESVVALVLDGAGGARVLDREALARWTPRDGARWVRVDPATDEGRQWIVDDSGLPTGDRDTLLRRPVRETRAEVIEGRALLVSLRTFAPETGEPLQVRCLVRADRLITVSSDDFPAFETCRARLAEGRGPTTAAGVVLTALRAATEIDQFAAINLDQEVTELEGSTERDLGKTLEPLRDTWQRGTALAPAALGCTAAWRSCSSSKEDLTGAMLATCSRTRGETRSGATASSSRRSTTC